MKLELVKIEGNRLIPATDSDAEKLKKFAKGEVIDVSIKKMRNVGNHRRFFALLKMVYENTDCFHSMEGCRYYLLMKAGYYEQIVLDRETIFVPKSMSFTSMDELEFQKMFEAVIEVIVQNFGWKNETINQNIQDFM